MRADAADAARKVVADIAAFITKDFSDHVYRRSNRWRLARRLCTFGGILAPIDVPIFVVPGNHDKR